MLFTYVGTLGESALVPTDNKFYLAPNVALIRFNKPFIPLFFRQYMSTSDFYFHIIIPFSGSSSQPALSMQSIRLFPIKYPKINEQNQIGQLLFILENAINLQQRQIDNYKKLKQGLLQKLFPVDGEKVPVLRFANFHDNWEQREFKNMIEAMHTGTNLLGKDDGNGMPLIKMGNIQRGYFDLSKLQYVNKNENIEKKNTVQYGDFLFNTRNTLDLVGKGATWFGENSKFGFNNNIAILVFKNIDTTFFNYLYNTWESIKKIHSRAVGTTSVAAIYPHDLDLLSFSIPEFNEQREIGEIFKSVDDIIILQQKKLKKLQQLKKFYLQNLFI